MSAMEKSIFSREYDLLKRMLRESRDAAKLTQTELAGRLHETQSYVSKVERGSGDSISCSCVHFAGR